MSPEERAAAICAEIAARDAIFDGRSLIGMPRVDRTRYIARSESHAPLIAQAIREAEDAALERAAARCDEFATAQMTPPVSGYIEGRHDAAQALAGHILNLKSKGN